jgi:hypothetical protein
MVADAAGDSPRAVRLQALDQEVLAAHLRGRAAGRGLQRRRIGAAIEGPLPGLHHLLGRDHQRDAVLPERRLVPRADGRLADDRRLVLGHGDAVVRPQLGGRGRIAGLAGRGDPLAQASRTMSATGAARW